MARKRKVRETSPTCVHVKVPVDASHIGFAARHVAIHLDTPARQRAVEAWLAGMRREGFTAKGERTVTSVSSLLYWLLDQIAHDAVNGATEINVQVPVDAAATRPYPARTVEGRLFAHRRYVAMQTLVGGCQRDGVRVGTRYAERAPDVVRYVLDQIAKGIGAC